MTQLDSHMQRAWMLLQQSRQKLAEQELRLALAERPDHGTAHALLALALSGQNRHQEAGDAAQAAVGLAPDDGFAHYVHSRVLAEANCFPEAEAAVKRAIELDSDHASYFAQLASICVQQKRWQEALAAAEQGLELDPENDACVNLQARALTALGHRVAASQTLQGALERDPEDAWTHANLGWTLLESRQYAKALEHFREALRLEPDSEYARQGIVTALKAQNILYRPLLSYFLWAEKLKTRYMWIFVIGFYLLVQGLGAIAATNPRFAPFFTPVVVVYVLFALSSWLADSLFNLVLFTNRFGRLALSNEQKKTSLWVGSALLLALGLYLGSLSVDMLFNASIGVLLALLPLTTFYLVEQGWPRWAVAGMALLVLLMGSSLLLAVGLQWAIPAIPDAPLVSLVSASFSNLGYAAIGTQIASQMLVIRRPRRINPRRF